MEDKWFLVTLCFYGSLPILTLIIFAIWGAARAASWADDNEVKPNGEYSDRPQDGL